MQIVGVTNEMIDDKGRDITTINSNWFGDIWEIYLYTYPMGINVNCYVWNLYIVSFQFHFQYDIRHVSRRSFNECDWTTLC